MHQEDAAFLGSDNSRANSPHAGAPGPVRAHPVGPDRVGPPAWWCWRIGSESQVELWRKEAGLLGRANAGS